MNPLYVYLGHILAIIIRLILLESISRLDKMYYGVVSIRVLLLADTGEVITIDPTGREFLQAKNARNNSRYIRGKIIKRQPLPSRVDSTIID